MECGALRRRAACQTFKRDSLRKLGAFAIPSRANEFAIEAFTLRKLNKNGLPWVGSEG